MKNFMFAFTCVIVLYHARAFIFKCQGNECPPTETTLTQVVLSNSCNMTVTLLKSSAAVSVVSDEGSRTRLPKCLTCPLTLQTESQDTQLLATVYSLGTMVASNGTCSQTRLDIYDGEEMTSAALLSEDAGVCGNTLPRTTFLSTSNSLTIHLATYCPAREPPIARGLLIELGNFNIIVSTLQTDTQPRMCRGQFQCKCGKCINKNRVCNDNFDCPDHSDETGCRLTCSAVSPWITVMLGLGTLLFCIGLITCVVRRCCCDKVQYGYTKVGYTKV